MGSGAEDEVLGCARQHLRWSSALDRKDSLCRGSGSRINFEGLRPFQLVSGRFSSVMTALHSHTQLQLLLLGTYLVFPKGQRVPEGLQLVVLKLFLVGLHPF